MNTQTRAGERAKSPVLAAILSFVLPGAGHWYVGAHRSAVIYFLPAAIVAVALAVRLAGGVQRIALDLLTPEFSLTIIALVVAAGLWRIAAMLDATRLAARRARHFRVPERSVIAALAVAIVAMHGIGTVYTQSFYSAGSQIFVAEDDAPASQDPAASGTPEPEPSGEYAGGLEPTDPNASPEPSDAPSAHGRLNVLLVGVDSGPGRSHALTDTMVVVSVDPVDKTVAMVSIPRDVSDFKLADGRTYTGKINSLASYVRRNPTAFEKNDFTTLAGAAGSIVGIPVRYYASIDLQGFTRMIDAVGGVDIINETAINDPGYGGWTTKRVGFYLSKGKHQLDGETALAFARSRKGVGDNDFTRAKRQQQLLVALKDKMTDPAMLPKLPSLLEAAGKAMRTNYPAAEIDELLTLAQEIPSKAVTKAVLGPPYSVSLPYSQTGGIYKLHLVRDKVAELSIKLFGADSSYSK